MKKLDNKQYIRVPAIRDKDKDKEKRKILIWAKIYKAIKELGGKCHKCNEKRIWLLCFHHIIPEEKEESINFLKNSKVRFSKLLQEVNKCQLLCQNCHREAHTNLFLDSKNKYSISRKLIVENNKKICLLYKNTLKCTQCNYSKCLAALEFHHIDTATKEFKISKDITSYSWSDVSSLQDRIKIELDKCVVLCRNCHQVYHTDVSFITDNWNDIVNKSNSLSEKTIVNQKKVVELAKKGLDRNEIATMLNCSAIRVWEILKSNNLTVPKKIINKKSIIDLFNLKHRMRDIERITGYSKSTVFKTIRDFKNENNFGSNKHNP
jgi:hypothetical protein